MNKRNENKNSFYHSSSEKKKSLIISGVRQTHKIIKDTYLNIVCTATIVLQSDRESSSAELDNSLFTTTTFSAKVIPALSRSSKLKKKIIMFQEIL